MELITERLVLRPWRASDAPALYALARDPEVGPRAGWRPHASVEESRSIIDTVLSGPESYAICLRASDGTAAGIVGCIGLTGPGASAWATTAGEYELGFWCGRSHWGRGYIPEAARALIVHARETLGARRIWCAFYVGNAPSLRVQEKLGIVFHHLERGVQVPRLGETRDEMVGYLDLTGASSTEQAIAALEAMPEPDYFRCVIEPLMLGRTQVRFLDPELGVLTRCEAAGCYYAAPFSEEGARAIRAAIVSDAVVFVSDVRYAPLIAPGSEPNHYEFWIYRGVEPPALPATDLTLRALGSADLDAVAGRYTMLSRADILDHLEHGWIIGGFDGAGELVGFIGEHDEASMGILEVFPEARRRGYAQVLETVQMRRFMAAGRTPYCHVVPTNTASKALQTKLGLVRVGPEQCWVHAPATAAPAACAASAADADS